MFVFEHLFDDVFENLFWNDFRDHVDYFACLLGSLSVALLSHWPMKCLGLPGSAQRSSQKWSTDYLSETRSSQDDGT